MTWGKIPPLPNFPSAERGLLQHSGVLRNSVCTLCQHRHVGVHLLDDYERPDACITVVAWEQGHHARKHTSKTANQYRVELGSKSQRRAAKQAVLSLLLLFNQFDLAEGANNGPVKPRVVAVAAAATEVPPHHPTAAQEAGAKRCGIGPQGQPHMMRKRALRRAINPAQRTELAQCRGRTIRAERQPCDDELPPLIVD